MASAGAGAIPSPTVAAKRRHSPPQISPDRTTVPGATTAPAATIAASSTCSRKGGKVRAVGGPHGTTLFALHAGPWLVTPRPVRQLQPDVAARAPPLRPPLQQATHRGALKQRGVHANEGTVANGAAVQGGLVAHRHLAPNRGVQRVRAQRRRCGADHAAVLHIRLVANADAAAVGCGTAEAAHAAVSGGGAQRGRAAQRWVHGPRAAAATAPRMTEP